MLFPQENKLSRDIFITMLYFKKIIKKRKQNNRLKFEYSKISKFKKMIKFVYQNSPRGTGDAILRCQKLIKSKYFLNVVAWWFNNEI